MAKKRHHIVSQEAYQRYLEDKMTPRERHEFERHLLDHEFEEEALEGLEGLSERELAEDMSDLKASLASRIHRSSSFIIWRVAAAVVLLGLFSFMVYYFIDQGAMKNERSLTKADKVENAESESSVSEEIIEEQDSSEILAYQQDLTEPVKVLVEEQDLDHKAEPSAKAVVDEKVNVEKPVTLSQEYDKALDIDEDLEVEIPAAIAFDRAEISEERTKKMESKPVAKEMAAPAVEQVRGAEARQALLHAEESDTRTIRGVVRADEDNTAVPGVNVIWKGSSAGTTTDIDGNFTIDIPSKEDGILVFSFIGFSTMEIPVNNQEYIEVVMQADLKQLTEVVVVDPIGRKRRSRSGAVSTVDERELDNPPQPIGGDKAFREYVSQNINYPSSAIDEKIRGTVVLKFKVGISGEISEIEVEKSLGRDFDQEAIRLVHEGPKWEPAKVNDSTVVREAKVKIRFSPPK